MEELTAIFVAYVSMAVTLLLFREFFWGRSKK